MCCILGIQIRLSFPFFLDLGFASILIFDSVNLEVCSPPMSVDKLLIF
jgi:hypothetical protein